jgi:hypothetical protein
MKGDSPEFLEKVRLAAKQIARKTKEALKKQYFASKHGDFELKVGDLEYRRLYKLIAKLSAKYLAEIADPAVRFRVAMRLSRQWDLQQDAEKAAGGSDG